MDTDRSCESHEIQFKHLKGSERSLLFAFWWYTNPDKENEEYIINIKRNVVHASENFDHLYNFTIEIIKKDKDFISEQTKAEINEFRKNSNAIPMQR